MKFTAGIGNLGLALIIVFSLSESLHAQTILTSGTPVLFRLTSIYDVLYNGTNGYAIPITAGPLILMVNVQVSPSTVDVNVFARCGSDVGGSVEAPVFDSVAATSNGTANVFVARPNGGTAGFCYVALEPKTEPPSSLGTGGRLTATILPFPAGTQVTVSSLGSILLAGQPGGTKSGTLSAPSNSPTPAGIAITPGQGYNILASGSITAPGQVGGAAPEGAAIFAFGASGPGTTTGAFGLSDFAAPQASLVGVFIGSSVDSTHTPLGIDWNGGDIQHLQTLYPLLQQVFYIGNGMAGNVLPRVFVAPPGATQLFLASAAGGFNATGSFTASISTAAAIPTVAPTTNPVYIPGLADLFLADQPPGTALGSKLVTASLPYSSPPQVPITITAGQTLHIRVANSISGGSSATSAAEGLSGMATPSGLYGVFVGNSIDSTHTPAAIDPAETVQTVSPLLQQTFYIGSGLTTTGAVKGFVVPTGATRLFLANSGGGLTTSGYAVAMVTPDNANAPQIAAGGIVNNAGFATGAIAPGSMAAIFGANFGPATSPSSVPLPTTLGGTQVFFNTTPAPLVYVSPGQIVVQVPYEMYGLDSALVTVIVNGVASVAQPVALSSFAGQIFTTGAGNPVITDANTGAIVSTSAPATRGDTLILWGTGLGLTQFDAPTGNSAPGVASPTLLPITVTLKSAATGATVSGTLVYAGLAPGFIALDQINVQIPTNAPTGTVILQLSSPGLTAPTPVTIGIQ